MVEAHSLPQSPTSGKHAKDTLELALSAKYFFVPGLEDAQRNRRRNEAPGDFTSFMFDGDYWRDVTVIRGSKFGS